MITVNEFSSAVLYYFPEGKLTEDTQLQYYCYEYPKELKLRIKVYYCKTAMHPWKICWINDKSISTIRTGQHFLEMISAFLEAVTKQTINR